MSNKKKLALLSNVTIDLLATKLQRQYDFYIPEGFDTWVQEVINEHSEIYEHIVDAFIILLDGTEVRQWTSMDDRISIWKQAVATLAKRVKNIPIFVSTIDIRENRIKALSERKLRYTLENDWYQFVQELQHNIYILDIADVIADIGRDHFYSNKMWYMSNMPYSREGLDAVAQEIHRVINAAFAPRKKVIALDLDNTLWGGVIGEDGIEGIELSTHKEGQRFYDFQRQLFEMKKRGIVLAINSKNNTEDAEEVIKKHPAMLLRDDAFVCKKINWESKALNLKAMESELNITENGFVFIDDNHMEQEIVKGECPEVLVPTFPIDTTELLNFAENIWFDYCVPLRVLDEDTAKTQMYQNDAKRKEDFASSLTLDEYIRKLEITVDIHKMRLEELERVTQLINKTNQFNLTTKRYTQTEVEKLAKESCVYTIHCSDKYGDNGLISVLILTDSEQSTKIDTFLMSCRVMGRKLENVIINEIADVHKNILAEYIPTAKNTPVRDLYDKLGFELVHSNEDGSRLYILKDYKRQDFLSIYKEIHFEAM